MARVLRVIFRNRLFPKLALMLLFSSLAVSCGKTQFFSPAKLRFAVITDTHLDNFLRDHSDVSVSDYSAVWPAVPQDIQLRFRRVLKAIRNENLDFLVITGDLVNLVSGSNVKMLREEIERSGLRVYTVPGNHDRVIPGKESPEWRTSQPGLNAYSEWSECLAAWVEGGWSPIAGSFNRERRCFIFWDNSDGKFHEADLNAASEFMEQESCPEAFIFYHIPLRLPNESLVAQRLFGKGYGPPYISGKEDIFGTPPVHSFLHRFRDRMVWAFAGHIHAFAEDAQESGFRQVVLQNAFAAGQYAIVTCGEKSPCGFEVRYAW